MADKKRKRVFFRRAAAAALLLTCLLSCSARAGYEVESLEGEDYFPNESEWTYHYVYSWPQLVCGGEDAAAMMVNDTFGMVLDEMRTLALPMFAASPEMTAAGPVEVKQFYTVTCNTDRLFSVLLVKTEEQGEKRRISVESETFDVGGEYPGETLTLRGVVRVGESSDQLAEAVLPVLYARFQELQRAGVCRADVTEAEFYDLTVPTLDFYADGEENAVFYLQPSLMTEPDWNVPSFPFTPAELEALAEKGPSGADGE